MSGVLVAGLVAGYGIAVPVGAVAAYLVSLSAERGLRTGMAGALGVATTDGVYALIAATAGSALAPYLASAATPIRIGSALVLAALAVRILLHSNKKPEPISANRAYLSLLGLTALNPTTVVYFTALVLGSPPDNAAALFAAAAFVASASWQLLLACGGALLGRLITGNTGRRITAIVSSALILGLAAYQLTCGVLNCG